MAVPIETYRGIPIFETAALQLVVPPVQCRFCIDGTETDEGPTLRTFASIAEAKEAIDDDAESLALSRPHH